VPWAAGPDTSFLLTADETRAAVRAAGFAEVSFLDQSALAAEWFRALVGGVRGSAGGAAAPLIGLPVVMGEGFPAMAANLADNLIHGRVGVIQLVARAV
jgi:sarcosine/dimethylglycine N-methyltransferase